VAYDADQVKNIEHKGCVIPCRVLSKWCTDERQENT
jgi:hypothetical protein